MSGAEQPRPVDPQPHVEVPAAADASPADLLRAQLADRQGLIDSSLPTLAFLLAYLLTGQRLGPALVAALAAGAVVAVVRAVRRQPLQHIATGFVAVAFAAFIASRTGRAEDFFLPGLLLNLAYFAAFAGSALIRRPLVGLGIGFMTKDGGAWRQDEALRRAAYRATWLWAAVFGLRLAVQVPLYWASEVGWLGTAKLLLGFPLFALAGIATYRLLSGPLARRRSGTPQG